MENNILASMIMFVGLAFLALNLKIQHVILKDPPHLGESITKIGYIMLAAGLVLILLGFLILSIFRLLAFTWFSMGVALLLFSVSAIVQGKRIIGIGTDQTKLKKTLGFWSLFALIVAAIAIIGLSAWAVLSSLK